MESLLMDVVRLPKVLPNFGMTTDQAAKKVLNTLH